MAIARLLPLLPLLLIFSPLPIALSLPSSSSSSSSDGFSMPDPGSFRQWTGQQPDQNGIVGYQSSYSRSPEVQDQCATALSGVATESSPRPSMPNADESKMWMIRHELSFLNGDWQQDQGTAPLIPFVPPGSNSNQTSRYPAHLASLWVTDVVVQKGSGGRMANVSAVLQLAISGERDLSFMGSGLEGTQIYPGYSVMSILMEGVYVEQQNGERVLCMLGCSKLPVRGKNASLPWDWLPQPFDSSFVPPLLPDCNLMADLHYPKTLSLTSRAVRGRLTSFHAPSTHGYFNGIDLTSQLGAYSNYDFSSGDLVSMACDNPQRAQGVPAPPQKLYKGDRFCAVAMQLFASQRLDVMPNWNCSSPEVICSKLGPFSKTVELQEVDGGFNGTQLLIQDVRCVDFVDKSGTQNANMSAVFRAVPPTQNPNLALERSALDSLALAAEGKWSNSSGQLCMVGCRGDFRLDAARSESKKHEACDIRICIYIPLTLSLKERSILLGSIAPVDDKNGSFYPLTFQLLMHPPQVPMEILKNMSYQYSKIKDAGAMLEKEETIGFGEKIKKSLLKYPSMNSEDTEGNFMVLSEDLSVHSLAITNPSSQKGPHVRQYVELDVIAIEEYVGIDWMQAMSTTPMAAFSSQDAVPKIEEQKNLLKIAAQISLKNNLGKVFSEVAVEGEYDPTEGKMFLVGCRQVTAPWQVFKENAELLEDGLDCLIEVIVKYPPTNARWLMNPTLMLTVTSTRTEDDPLFFPKIELETFPILYKRQREEIVSRKSIEGVLSMLTLSLMVGCIISQLLYVRSHTDSTPYISLLMLLVQAIGYSIPLITGVEALFARMTSDAEDMKSSVLNEGKWTQSIGYMVKILTLAAFLLTLRIGQKVYKSRIRLGTRRPLELWRVPNDKKVLAIFSGIHAFGFVTVLIIHAIRVSQRPVNSSTYIDWSGDIHKQHDWERELKEYFGLVQDLFLLPQVVGNHLWQVKGKPLRMLFYVGVTVLRLLPHVYDSLRSPVFNPYFSDEYEYANPDSDFYSKFGDIAIPLLAVVLAAVVYIQQRWNGLKWGNVLRSGSSKLLLRMGSKMYERLPSKTFEAEMIESVNQSGISENGHVALSCEN